MTTLDFAALEQAALRPCSVAPSIDQVTSGSREIASHRCTARLESRQSHQTKRAANVGPELVAMLARNYSQGCAAQERPLSGPQAEHLQVKSCGSVHHHQRLLLRSGTMTQGTPREPRRYSGSFRGAQLIEYAPRSSLPRREGLVQEKGELGWVES